MMDALTDKPEANDAGTDKPSAPAERPSRDEAEAAVRTLIAWIGDDPARSGLVDTPRRVIDAFAELYGGYGKPASDLLERTFEDLETYDDIVIVRDIPVVSHCEHHMMPFTGKAHVAYYPNELVAGLSKLARVVDLFARRLQSQERLTAQVLESVDEILKPRGTAVMVDTEHSCMTLRGVKAHGATTVTTMFSGVFRDDPQEQMRFLSLVGASARG